MCQGRTLHDVEDAQSATGFGVQVGNVTLPGKIMADCETQKLERKDFFQRIVEKVDGGFFFQTVLSERHSESVRFVRIERHVPRVGPDCDFYPDLQRAKRLLVVDLRDDMIWQKVESSAKR